MSFTLPKPDWAMVRHAVFWIGATALFQYEPTEVAIRFPLAFALGLACVALALAARALSTGGNAGRLLRGAYIAAAVVILGVLSLYAAHVWGGGELHAQVIEAVLQSDPLEAFSYFVERLLVLWALLWTVSAALFWATYPRTIGPLARKWWVQALLLFVGAGLLFAGRGIVTKTTELADSYRDGTAALHRSVERWNANPHPPLASDFKGTVIVVMGESMSRHHMSLYGYPRPTTPRLDRLAPELAVFDDAIANYSSTIESVIDALTLAGSNPDLATPDGKIGVLQLASAAGYETAWLSNQNEFGVWDNPVRILAGQADRVRFHDRGLGELGLRRVFGEAMLPSLRAELARPGAERKLIVMHLMVPHLPYCSTKPPDFNPLREDFGARLFGRRPGLRARIRDAFSNRAEELDCYDNGVRYADSLIGEIIEQARGLDEPAAVLMLSDHGQAPLLGTDHDSSRHSSYHIEIPLVLWGNAAWRAANPGLWNAARANGAQPFALDRMAPTLIDLLQIETPAASPHDSLFSRAFQPRKRQAIDGRIRYDERSPDNDYRENSRVFVRELGPAADRVWAHRINSLGALLEAKRTFAGIEIDVHFDMATRRFQVRHDYPHIGLTLADMLSWSRDRPDLQIWLDWKNADPDNVAAALARLETLDKRFSLMDRMLVETGSEATSPALAAIPRAGFRRGYYLPAERIEAAMRTGPAATDALAAGLTATLTRGEFDAVTYDAVLQPFVDRRLGPFLRKRGLGRYSWQTSIDTGDARTDPAAVARAVGKRGLDALLVKFPTDFWI